MKCIRQQSDQFQMVVLNILFQITQTSDFLIISCLLVLEQL